MKGWHGLKSVSLGGLLLLTACGGAADDAAAPPIKGIEAEQEVSSLLKAHCMTCHGNDLQGLVGPSLQAIGSSMSKEEIYAVVAEGAKGMPAFKSRLDEQQLDALAEWLASQKE